MVAALANGKRFLDMSLMNFAPRLVWRVSDREPYGGSRRVRHLQFELHQPGPDSGLWLRDHRILLLGGLRNHSGVQPGWRIPAELPPSARHRSDGSESQSVTAVLPDQYRLPYKIQWNFLIEHQFANDLSRALLMWQTRVGTSMRRRT